MTVTDSAPVRRRPKDRRQQILTAAAELFQRGGYDGVSMADIARAVDITPGAIYRHFTSKTEVLRHCLDAALGTLEDALRNRTGDGIDPTLEALAGIPTSGYLGLMWTRDAQGLPEETSREVAERFERIAGQVRAALAGDRTGLSPAQLELVTWSVIAVFTSVSLYRVRLSEPQRRALLLRAARAVVDCPLASGGESPAPAAPGVERSSRRARLLNAAAEMFAEKGFPSVSMEDIGARADVSAAMVYQYFENKTAILWAAQSRGTQVLEAQLTDDFRAAHSPADALDRVLRSYVRFSIRNPHIIKNLTASIPHLNADQRADARRNSSDYLQEWFTLVQAADPVVNREHARGAVHATLAVVHTAVRTPALSAQPGLAENLRRLGAATLAAAAAPPT